MRDLGGARVVFGRPIRVDTASSLSYNDRQQAKEKLLCGFDIWPDREEIVKRINRRQFLGGSTRGLLGAYAATLPLAVKKSVSAASANERIVFGLIGLGGRGVSLMRTFLGRSDVEFAYLCDVDERRRDEVVRALRSRESRTPRRVSDLRQVLEDKDVDAVIVATPDHWHGLATIMACQAGKDVYVEKPPSHNVWEGRKIVEAARRYKRIVQVGTQNRSAPYVHKALEYVHGGNLGKIALCKVFNMKSGGPWRMGGEGKQPEGLDWNRWLGPAPERPYNERIHHGGWHCLWDFSGGDMADDGIHQLDIGRWLIGKDYARSVHCSGGNFAFKDDREVPDTQIVTYDFDGLVMTFELTQWAPYMSKTPGDIRGSDRFPYWPQNSTRVEFYGTKEQMIMGRHGGGWQVLTGDGKPVAQEYGRPGDAPHRDNFIECIRSRKLPTADIEEGHRSAVLVHLANISYRVGGRKLIFDARTETFVDDDQANKLIKREYREPFVIPERV